MNSIPRLPAMILTALLSTGTVHSDVPKSELYPFGATELQKVRSITNAEKIPDSPDLVLAWSLYEAVQGSWKPDAPKLEAGTVRKIDKLRARLEKAPKPTGFADALTSSNQPESQASLASSKDDKAFAEQADSPEYQAQKALAILYLAEHELDRLAAADKAGMQLTLLSLKHPWDWQIHALYARLLVDAGLSEPAFNAALTSIYLNPAPDPSDLEFFAFVGKADHQSFDAISEVIRDAAPNPEIAGKVVERLTGLFEPGNAVRVIPPKSL